MKSQKINDEIILGENQEYYKYSWTMLIFKYAQYYLNVVFLVKSLMGLTVQNPYYDMAQYFWKTHVYWCL